jgi:hypothetical protein
MNRRPDRGYGLYRSSDFPVLIGWSPVWSRSFSSLVTGLSNTTSFLHFLTNMNISSPGSVTISGVVILQLPPWAIDPQKVPDISLLMQTFMALRLHKNYFGSPDIRGDVRYRTVTKLSKILLQVNHKLVPEENKLCVRQLKHVTYI